MPLGALPPVLMLLVMLSSMRGSQAGQLRAAVHPQLEAFPLSAVKLRAGSQEARAAELNAKYLRMLEPDSLLWAFRNNAGLPTPGTPYLNVRTPRRISMHWEHVPVSSGDGNILRDWC